MTQDGEIPTIGKPIESLEQFIATLNDLRTRRPSEAFWFRGQRDEKWPLEPGLLRPPYTNDPPKHERGFKALHACYGPSLCDDYPASWIDQLVLMQHRGCPTRLLDWTEGALVGLYFAVARLGAEGDTCDASVYVLAPVAVTMLLPEQFFLKRMVTSTTLRQRDVEDYVKGEYLSELPFTTPIPFIPTYVDARILAQKGRFTLHPLVDGALRQSAQGTEPAPLMRLRIQGTAKREIYMQLAAAGITETTLFPDLDALSRELRIKLSNGKDIP
jgi:hypothetical protein